LRHYDETRDGAAAQRLATKGRWQQTAVGNKRLLATNGCWQRRAVGNEQLLVLLVTELSGK
jgi:hypothetical protein